MSERKLIQAAKRSDVKTVQVHWSILIYLQRLLK